MKNFILILACLVIIQSCPAQPVRESSPQKIKILSWNIYMLPGFLARLNGKRATMIGHALAESDYDVIVFQEAFCPVARRKIRAQLERQFAFEAGPANRKWFSMKTNSGIWIVSRFPIQGYQSIAFRNKFGADALSRKGALLVDLMVNDKKVQVIGTHLQNSGSPWLRHAQCVELYERLLKPNREEGVPQIVCGDFNINKNTAEESYRFMLTSLGAVDGKLQGERKFTYDRLHNDLHVESGEKQDLIDYILLRENGAWVDCTYRQIRAIRKQWNSRHEDLSDHYAMEAEFRFTNHAELVSLNTH